MNFSILMLQTLLFINTVTVCFGWQYFTYFKDIILTDSERETDEMHSEYYFGDCDRKDKILLAHIHKNHMEVLGKLIIRGWLKIKRMPICIILRARSHKVDMFRSTAYNFQICTPRIAYAHSYTRFVYYFYEWYLPYDLVGGMNWDIYFWGPPTLDW